jgi:UDP-glucuronate decarboxylase
MNPDEIKKEVVNLNNTNEVGIDEFAEILHSVCDVEIRLTYKELFDGPKRPRPVIGKAKQNLDWMPEVPLREGIRYTVEYLSERG